MTNKYENGSPQENSLEKKKNSLYHQVQQSILEGGGYDFSLDMKEEMAKMASESGLALRDVQLYILERFNREEGALADKLGEIYTDLIYSQENIESKMESGKTFYEVIANINAELREKGIFLNIEEVNRRIEELEKDIVRSEAA